MVVTSTSRGKSSWDFYIKYNETAIVKTSRGLGSHRARECRGTGKWSQCSRFQVPRSKGSFDDVAGDVDIAETGR